MHRPFLKKGHTELQSKYRNAQYSDTTAYKNLFMGTQGEEAAAAALSITEDMTTDLFDALERAGLQNNTLVSFLSDHGESTAPSSTRLGGPTSLYLASPLWLHVPGMFVCVCGGGGDATRSDDESINQPVQPIQTKSTRPHPCRPRARRRRRLPRQSRQAHLQPRPHAHPGRTARVE